jgi:hypothetical protein
MKSLDLEQAAQFLKMSAEVLRKKAKAGDVPARKTGKSWVFIEEHLADWVSGRYSEHGRELRVIEGGKQQKEDKLCLSINAAKIKRGGLTSQHPMATEYEKALGLKTSNKRKNSRIS